MFGPADFMASVGIRSLDVGGQPEGYVGGDAYHYALMRILIAARSRGLQAPQNGQGHRGPANAVGHAEIPKATELVPIRAVEHQR